MVKMNLIYSSWGDERKITDLLVSSMCPLQFITHEITMAYGRRAISTRAPFRGERNKPGEPRPSLSLRCNSTTGWKQLNNCLAIFFDLGVVSGLN